MQGYILYNSNTGVISLSNGADLGLGLGAGVKVTLSTTCYTCIALGEIYIWLLE